MKSDWEGFFVKKKIYVEITRDTIAVRTFSDDGTKICLISVEWPAEDSGLLRDSLWRLVRKEVPEGDPCAPFTYYKRSGGPAVPFPRHVAVRYAVNRSDTMTDTVPLSTAGEYLESIKAKRRAILAWGMADTNEYEVTWDLSRLGDCRFMYMTIGVDEGPLGGDYYVSHPYYCKSSEDRGKDGQRTLFGRYSPGEGRFVFRSSRNLAPVVWTLKPIKIHPTHVISAYYYVHADTPG